MSKGRTQLPPPPAWASELDTVGVTGTNGKTSTTMMVASALSRGASPVAQVTTVGSYLDRERLDVANTYGGFIETLKAAHDRGGRFAAIELTSEALAIGFAQAWPCKVGVFTNLTRDHLDAHGSAEHYLASKAQLFMQLPEGGAAVLNAADSASELLAEVVPKHARLLRYGVPSRGELEGQVDLRARQVTLGWQGTRIAIEASAELGTLPDEVVIPPIGEVFAENALAAIAAAIGAGLPAALAVEGVAEAPAPPGRFEVVAEAPHVVVDYAHTPDALQRTLAAARRLCSGKLTVVFGAGGERDQAKRPLMGEAATTADRIVLTNDNPRGEDPAAIAAAIQGGIEAGFDVTLQLDRERAICGALRDADDDDVVVIAGKGHETTQTIGEQTRTLSDRDIVREALRG